jgi:hypothetical protein
MHRARWRTGFNLQAGKPEPFISSPADETASAFSPDGKWLAYTSNQSGTYQVYVRSLKHPGATWQFATPKLLGPQWSPGGGEVFLRTGGALDGFGYWRVLVASYSVKGDTFVPGAVRAFGGNLRIPTHGAASVFAVAPNGKRIAAVQEAKEPEGAGPDYILLLNFFDEIKRRAAQTTAQ